MVQDSFYGKTWQGIFTACQLRYDVNGPAVKNTVRASSTSAVSSADIVSAMPPGQAARSTMVPPPPPCHRCRRRRRQPCMLDLVASSAWALHLAWPEVDEMK